jgi:hypothetical protein
MHGLSRSRSDPRDDVVRGFALGNTLATLTLIIFGFSDPAELFVILAGLSSLMAYGERFARCRIGSGLRRITAGCQPAALYQAGCSLS